MEYMVWVVEITAKEFFKHDKTAAYQALVDSSLWDIYVRNYDTTHCLGSQYILEEMREYFATNGVVTA